jgi:general secretion pathway protein E
VGGERVTVRLLQGGAPIRPLAELRLMHAQATVLERAAHQAGGLLVVAGPAGSGRTASLYSMLAASGSGDRHAITVEDPVEYELPGVTQVDANGRFGVQIAAAVRAALSHDPDVLLVGEVRGTDTAQVVGHACAGGRKVLAGLAATDAFAARNHLHDLGIDSGVLRATGSLVLAQRLVRRTCRDCRGAGCPACEQSGWSGRHLVAEILDCRDDALVAATTMRASALAFAAAGWTTVAEAVAATPDPVS